jgi:hypothetical protein
VPNEQRKVYPEQTPKYESEVERITLIAPSLITQTPSHPTHAKRESKSGRMNLPQFTDHQVLQ